jgi:FMN phosphatase YigB (HAD superfamily)
MITIALFDLGRTLEDNNAVFPGVPAALATIRQLVTAADEKLVMCLASDYTMPEPRTPAAIDALFREYLGIVKALGLLTYFEPVEQRVTLSTQAGVLKPERAFFETALRRAGMPVTPFANCLFVTEFTPHIEACREMGLATLQFGVDFTDWTEAPALIAQYVDPANKRNLEMALRPAAASFDIDLRTVDTVSGRTLRGTAKQLVPLRAADLGFLQGVHVPLSVGVEMRLDADGRIRDVRTDAPDPGDLDEASDFARSLLSNRQVAGIAAAPSVPGMLPTHDIQTDPSGRRLLVRRRFTAV